jgi:hypothetical protein
MKHKSRIVFLFIAFLTALVFTTCDMIMIVDPVPNKTGSREITDSERDELEKTGHFLKLVNLPLNTQLPNIFSVSVSNSLSAIAKLHKDNYILIFKEKDDEDNYASCTVYLPLSYNDDNEFTETGNFFTAFSIHVDALVKYVVEASDQFIVYYTDGRGQADVNDIHSAPSAGSKELTEKEKDELEKTGHFLKLANMPLNTQAPNVFSVSVSNSSAAIAKLDKNSAIFIFKETYTCTVYLPLSYNDDKEFTETGFFYTAFTIHIDAVTKYVVDSSDHFLVYYEDGRGQADVNNLPAPPSAGSKELTEKEKDELEKTGHFLKLVNMPLNTQVPNVFSVSVSNSSAAVAKLNKNDTVFIFKESNNCTVYLPLVYNDDKEFTETGYFFTAFTIHVDAITKYIVNVNDEFIVFYADGRGEADVNGLPSVSAPEPSYLTVMNLPPSVSVFNFSGVSVRNQTEVVAKCKDYSQIDMSSSNDKVTAKIPLHYNSLDKFFQETGVFYVLFDINVDVDTRYTLIENDQVKIPFINGNGSLDIQNIPEKPVPYLTIKGLPLNATKHQVSNVNVYNSTSSVASCSDVNSIVFFPENNLLTFLIPLKSSSGGYFLNSGDYYISFLVNIDVNNKIEINSSDKVLLYFTNGSAEFDVKSTYGYFKASLTNPDDFAKPVIAAGSSFDVNGHRAVISGNLTVPAITPESSCFLFLYAYFVDNTFYYEFSNTPPVYNSSKNGWYNGIKRALWKMIYLYNTSPPKYLFKTDMNHDFPQFGKYTFENSSDYSQLISGKSALGTINGSGNPAPQNISLDPGVYVVELVGAGGGNGRSYNSTSSGGSGGIIKEIITLDTKTSFTAFTGSGGDAAPAPTTPSGTFDVITTKNYYEYEAQGGAGQGGSGGATITSATLIISNTVVNTVTVSGSNASMSGGGGGGGGSGTFLYAASGYLLLAGGGSGGSGGSYLTPGGGGGSGGTIGPGAGGGGSGWLYLTSDAGTGGNFNAPGGKGGRGGGAGGGFAGPVAGNGGSAPSVILTSNSSINGGSGTASYPDFPFSSHFPFLYVSSGGYSWNGNGYITSNLVSTITNNRIVNVRTTFYVSGNSGSGGSAAAINSDNWLISTSAAASGADSQSLRNFTFSDIILSGRDSDTPGAFTTGSTTNSNPFYQSGDWDSSTPSFTPLSFTIGSRSGVTGSDGGNNRNSAKGGGAAAGGAGSINIYKIYDKLSQ